MSNKKFLTLFLLSLCLSLFIGLAHSAVTSPQIGVARAGATADVITNTYIPVGTKIIGVKVNPSTASKYYRLRNTNASGAILYETNSGATTTTMALDPVRFSMPGSGIYYQTDDASTNANIILYSE